MLEIAVVGSLVVMLTEAGKNAFPRLFSSTYNALLTVILAIFVNLVNAAVFGGDLRAASQAGVILGLSLVGAYRTVSSLSKKSSVDLSEQYVPMTLAPRLDDYEEKGDTVVQGFGK